MTEKNALVLLREEGVVESLDGPVHISDVSIMKALRITNAAQEKCGKSVHAIGKEILPNSCAMRRGDLVHITATILISALVLHGREVSKEAICTICPANICPGRNNLVSLT